MSSYRPMVDVWLLGRPKSKYYGAFPEGFLRRAKWLLRGHCIHICSGKLSPYFPVDQRNIEGDDKVDINPALRPTVACEATRLPIRDEAYESALIDRPYTIEDAKHYGDYPLPELGALVNEATRIVKTGGFIGTLDYKVPRPPKNLSLVALIPVLVGYGNNIRAFTVFRKEGL